MCDALILKGIGIKKFDPTNDHLSSGNPCTVFKIRTSLYFGTAYVYH